MSNFVSEFAVHRATDSSKFATHRVRWLLAFPGDCYCGSPGNRHVPDVGLNCKREFAHLTLNADS